MVHFAIDPNEKDLPFVCDLEFAPRNAERLVEFKGVIDLVKPVDMSKSNRSSKRAVDELVMEGLCFRKTARITPQRRKRKNPLDPAVTIEPLVTAGKED